MSTHRFFDEEVLTDDQRDKDSCLNGGTSPQSAYNDYRNRMPFHYISDDVPDGYYYWQFGQTISMEILFEDEVAFTSNNANFYVPISEFMKDSNRIIRFVLHDFRGQEIYRQETPANELIYDGATVIAKFNVTEKLSSLMVPNQYKLFIYIISYSSIKPENSVDYIEDYNKPLTENGIDIRVRG